MEVKQQHEDDEEPNLQPPLGTPDKMSAERARKRSKHVLGHIEGTLFSCPSLHLLTRYFSGSPIGTTWKRRIDCWNDGVHR